MVSMPVLPILLAFAAPGAVQRLDTSAVTQAQRVLHTPDAIAPAVLPYAACLYGVRGLPLLQGSNGALIKYDNRDGNCSAERRRAKSAALKLLGNGPVPGGGTSAAYVEDALSEIDAFVQSLPRGTAGASAHPPAIGIPLMLEDEVRPAYDHYESCLKTQVSFSQVSVDTILTVFMRAIDICRSVRESALIEAENALAKKGWDQTRRTKAAESTFATADQSWLELGRQYRQTFLSHMGGKR